MTEPDFRFSFFQGSQKNIYFLIPKKCGEAFLTTLFISGNFFRHIDTIIPEGMTKPDFRFSFCKGWRLAALELDLNAAKTTELVHIKSVVSTI